MTIISHGTTIAAEIRSIIRNLDNFSLSLSLLRNIMPKSITIAATKIWYFARNPTPRTNPVAISIFLSFSLIQEKNNIRESEKKNVIIVSSIAVLESQKNPGVTASITLANRAVFDP